MLDEGWFASVRELAEAERVSLSYLSRILRLTLLAPDIAERILDGRPASRLAELMQPFPASGRGNESGSKQWFADSALHKRSSKRQPQLEM
jgi:hypothetical protein